MSRTLTSAVEAALSSDNVPALVFVELDFSSGFVRVTNAAYNFSWDSKTWTGLGNLGDIEPAKESSELGAYGVSMKLSGIPSSMVSTALGEHYQGRGCKIWFAPLDSNYQVLADPVMIFHGRMDTMSINLGKTATIVLTAESRLADWDRPRVRRYNHADQIKFYPTDKGLEFIEQMVEKELVWGRG